MLYYIDLTQLGPTDTVFGVRVAEPGWEDPSPKPDLTIVIQDPSLKKNLPEFVCKNIEDIVL